MILNVFGKVAQSNARFSVLDTLFVVVLSVCLPIGFVDVAERTKG